MMYENGRRRSVANAESWSNMLTRYGRFLHSFSLLHSSKLDFGKDTCNGKRPECSKQSARIFRLAVAQGKPHIIFTRLGGPVRRCILSE